MEPSNVDAKKLCPHCGKLPSGYLRKRQAAIYLGISLRMLTNLMQQQVVPFHKVSHRCCLFKLQDLDDAIARFRVKAVGEK